MIQPIINQIISNVNKSIGFYATSKVVRPITIVYRKTNSKKDYTFKVLSLILKINNNISIILLSN